MEAPDYTERHAKRRASSCTSVVVDLASTVTIIAPCPIMHAGADGCIGRKAATIGLPFVCGRDRTVHCDIRGEAGIAGALISVVAALKARLARLIQHHTDYWGTIVSVGAVSFVLIGASARWIGRVVM